MSSEISKKVGSEVKIEKIEIGLFNRVILYDIKIKDKKGTNIISAKRLSAKIKTTLISKLSTYYQNNRIIWRENQYLQRERDLTL